MEDRRNRGRGPGDAEPGTRSRGMRTGDAAKRTAGTGRGPEESRSGKGAEVLAGHQAVADEGQRPGTALLRIARLEPYAVGLCEPLDDGRDDTALTADHGRSALAGQRADPGDRPVGIVRSGLFA